MALKTPKTPENPLKPPFLTPKPLKTPFLTPKPPKTPLFDSFGLQKDNFWTSKKSKRQKIDFWPNPRKSPTPITLFGGSQKQVGGKVDTSYKF